MCVLSTYRIYKPPTHKLQKNKGIELIFSTEVRMGIINETEIDGIENINENTQKSHKNIIYYKILNYWFSLF